MFNRFIIIFILFYIFHSYIASCDNNVFTNYKNHPNWPGNFEESCGVSNENRIVGGINASLGQYPWLARIGYDRRNSLEYACGGALITKRHVLTAAHCVTNLEQNVKVATILLGEHNALTEIDCAFNFCADLPQTFYPEKITFPPNYNNPMFKHDIAIIKLNKDARITEWVLPICLLSGDNAKREFVNEIGEVAGWGLTDSDHDEGSPFLQTVKLPIVSLSVCLSEYKNKIDLGKEQLCVGGEVGKDSCSGDSGGPLMKALQSPYGPKYFVIGLVSFGSKRCGVLTTPAIYTNLKYYMKWILDQLT